ncbi:PREDICTED: probable G-protein coupled receptor 141 [Dipodomys ordii]|uniref:Probable G-protein coupled receptor 141 n=1 Tax=Dipodomys ordii TaxID=10020 RepID=A0A1S3GS47_DIPOR|nr:PREDICTED: probable G-protein coupled receptor 141 [Dipodomys ordii]XP_012891515.1 PREDICTED: probable G-protein coupled receptor 141 [Dipodomys ordii]
MELINTTNPSNISNMDMDYCDAYCKMLLLALYSVIFLVGTAGTIMISPMMFRRNSQSMISTAVFNIVVLHSILLASLPFRLSYYLSGIWELGYFTCRVVSAILYGHMYFTFIFYVAIVTLRLLIYFKKLQMQPFQKYHAIMLSMAIWIVAGLIFLPIFFLQYGTDPSYSKKQRCFEFHRDLHHQGMVILNYSVIVVIMATVLILFLLQMAVILQLMKAHWPDMWAHQEFRAQIKSFFFLLVIVVCFIPHHAFRVYFIDQYSGKESSKLVLYNEICLALTTVCCLDVPCFIGGIVR